jgi:hypothetical protein
LIFDVSLNPGFRAKQAPWPLLIHIFHCVRWPIGAAFVLPQSAFFDEPLF